MSGSNRRISSIVRAGTPSTAPSALNRNPPAASAKAGSHAGTGQGRRVLGGGVVEMVGGGCADGGGESSTTRVSELLDMQARRQPVPCRSLEDPA